MHKIRDDRVSENPYSCIFYAVEIHIRSAETKRLNYYINEKLATNKLLHGKVSEEKNEALNFISRNIDDSWALKTKYN